MRNKRSIKNKRIPVVVAIIAGLSMTVSADNRSYTGGGVANDWNDPVNWNGAAAPVAGDNGLFVNAGVGTTINQSVAEFDQLQVGRGVDNTVTIDTGGVVTNLNQTVVGIVAGGRGTLVVDGGTLRTVQLRSAVAGGAANSIIQMKNGLLAIDKTPTSTKGTLDIGEVAYSTFDFSGGTMTVESNINIGRGIFNVIGDSGSVTTAESFNFGTAALTTARVGYELSLSRGVSTINADSFSYLAGSTRELIINGDNANPGAINVTLMSLATTPFAGADLTALQGILDTSNITGGTLSLANGDKDLVFSGTVVPEPATLSLIAIMGGGILFIRRRFMI